MKNEVIPVFHQIHGINPWCTTCSSNQAPSKFVPLQKKKDDEVLVGHQYYI
jgi:hypothetical protein